MTPLPPPASIRRCSARSRSFLLGPDGPARAPPGQRLRSGALIELRENREQKQDPYYEVSTVRGQPHCGSSLHPRQWTVLDILAVLCKLSWGQGFESP
jgi:hypothetical protein